jgi:hypothetical protein
LQFTRYVYLLLSLITLSFGIIMISVPVLNFYFGFFLNTISFLPWILITFIGLIGFDYSYRRLPRSGKQIGRKTVVISAVLILCLILFLVIPVISFNADGQTLFLGKTITPYNSSSNCSFFGCHCASQESLSYWLFGAGYFRFEGCRKLI